MAPADAGTGRGALPRLPASYAIAYATLAHLVSRIRPLTLFATHYHALTTEFADNALVQMRHMAFVVDAERCGREHRAPHPNASVDGPSTDGLTLPGVALRLGGAWM